MSRLLSKIRRLLDRLKPLFEEVVWAWRVVFRIWRILRDSKGPSEEVKRAILDFLAEVFGRKFLRSCNPRYYGGHDSDFALRFARHVVKTLRNWWDGLFSRYDDPLILKDNIIIERFNMSLKWFIRRVCSRRQVGLQLASYGWSLAFIVNCLDNLNLSSLWRCCDHVEVWRVFCRFRRVVRGFDVFAGYSPAVSYKGVLSKIIGEKYEIF